ncbi:PQQ-dependent sugar dehydrogenase [Kineosporia sp. NBRC 101731]|uniref:PQQ-dependent sugar dehydrogenase n=1 Tax=Kineosporia sp. NBRC 101731 TaxID=3032199 RepID=UPI0024A5F3EE|nr:PQQ-dependent sugar dehydrogenase [Kineosporia sp. NBRC 101731]GLY30099.1 oxidoreductase [Kineosporia sp. NBRC 101731]
MKTSHTIAAGSLVVMALSGCSSASDGSGGSGQVSVGASDEQTTPATPGGEPSDTGATTSTIKVPKATLGKTLATKLDVPWGVTFLADGSALVSERPSGDIVRITPKGKKSTVGTVPGVSDDGEGGLLGLALKPGARPTKAKPVNVWAYVHSTQGDNRVVRMSYDGNSLGKPKAVLTGIPASSIHNGGEITFGPDGKLWIGTGDGANTSNAQNKKSLGGKILRINSDGSAPKDNPYPGSPVYSLGHRNVQGIAFDSKKHPWAAEFGQDTWDELNRILPGKNYGWPVVEGKKKREGYVAPKVQWHTENASPSGLAIVDDVAYLGALRGERLWAVPLQNKTAGTPKSLFHQRFGRIRNVAATPAGDHLWITTSNTDGRGEPGKTDDRVLRIDLG